MMDLHTKALKALKAGVLRAKREHAQARVPMAIWKDGKVINIKPWLKKRSRTKYAVCIYNQGYEASLEKRKIYQILADKTAEQKNLLRVKDESGDSYLYPSRFFLLLKLPQTVMKGIDKAA